jgi:hypothetical protein
LHSVSQRPHHALLLYGLHGVLNVVCDDVDGAREGLVDLSEHLGQGHFMSGGKSADEENVG